ncbi:MAG: osmotically inducible lipoprotein OsmB [Gammaproteobacteria bacterium]|nr:osmotically inducible lipoprotein OsmB [Gammaproteobacteria bacterium]
MNKKVLSIVASGAISFLAMNLSACASRSDTGMVAGGVIGGAAGSAITGGSAVGTVAGAVGGAVIGRNVAR